jgi:3-methyladenine DNA glycosylase AlkD
MQLSYKQRTDEQRLFSFCLERAHETEFFIRKAIGWSLRQYARINKAAIKAFMEKNRDSFAPLSVREALKHC